MQRVTDIRKCVAYRRRGACQTAAARRAVFAAVRGAVAIVVQVQDEFHGIGICVAFAQRSEGAFFVSYRKEAWGMKQALEKLDPVLGALVDATPPWVEDPLKP